MIDGDDLRLRELEHRFRNILTIVRSIVSQTLNSARSIEDARAMVDHRLASLGGAIDSLLATHWQPTPLSDLVDRTFDHFPLFRGRIQCEGASVTIGASAAMTLMLVLYELATNAVKYGALSNQAGTIELRWTVLGDGNDASLWMQWAERGGPPVVRPDRQGFGSRLICTAASRSLHGRCELDFPASGITWTMIAPLSAIGN